MKKLTIFSLALLITGCSRELDLSVLEKQSAESIFASAKKSISMKKYKNAVEIMQEFEKLYPYSKLLPEAQLLEGDCSFKIKKYDNAITAYTIFIKTHPNHEKVAYALYMIGLIYFKQMQSTERDQEETARTLTYLFELQQRYPSSAYAKKAEIIIEKCNKQMAGREIHVARFYQSRGNYAAAIARLNTCLECYPNFNYAPEGLHRLVECYVAIGFLNEAFVVNDELQTRFLKTKWAGYSKKILAKVSKAEKTSNGSKAKIWSKNAKSLSNRANVEKSTASKCANQKRKK